MDKWILVLAFATVLTGCDSTQPQSQPAPAKPHYQRFVPIPPERAMTNGVPWDGFFALDTKTGTLCRTLTYKEFPKDSWANDVPACSQVLTANPD
jgi:hypothetical protein